MAENNEEQYLDELLNSLRSSNADDEADEVQDSEKPVADNDIVLDDGNEVVNGADDENGLYDDIGPIIDEEQPDDIGPIIDEEPSDDIAPIIDEPNSSAGADDSQPMDVSPADILSDEGLSNDSSSDDISLDNVLADGLSSQDNSSDESSSDDASSGDSASDIFALEDDFGMSGEQQDASEAGGDTQSDDIPLTLTDSDEGAQGQSDEGQASEADDDSDDGLMQLLNQINGEEGGQKAKADSVADGDKNGLGDTSKASKTSKNEEKERKKAEKLAKKEQRKKEKEEKKKNKKGKAETEEQPEEAAAEDSASSASQENIDLINELYSDTDSLDNAPLGDDLADIPERDAEEEEPKKPKKEKKKKEPKPKKPKKEKKKKEKREPKPSELVKVTPKTFLGIIIFVVVVTVVVIFGTKLVNYSVSLQHAIDHFNNGKYDQAYDSIAGLDVKDKDKDTYYKIRTVMSVYVDYTSYVSYKQLNMNVEALDSLIKGLVHYDDYYSDAEKYDVVAQYDGVKTAIIAALAQYGVSEDDARYYAGLESEQQYEEILNNIGGRMQ